MTLAITFAAQTTVPVTVTTQAGTTATVQMPTQLHATYASEVHTATVQHLADAPQQSPALAPQSGVGSTIGLSGGALIGLGLLIWTAAKWKASPKEVKGAFIKGLAVAVLIGSWGIFGIFSNTVKTTGDSTGAVIGTIGQAGTR